MQTIINALTYNGSYLDTTINAGVLILLVAALLRHRRWRWWIALVVLAALQVVLWFAVGVVGFSLVWAGLAGAAVVIYRRATRRRWLLAVAVLVALIAIVYYAVTFPPISTVAHLLALALGVGIQALAQRRTR